MKKIQKVLLFVAICFFSVFAFACKKCKEHIDENKDGKCDVCGAEVEVPVDYDALLTGAVDKVKITGVAASANRDFTVPLTLKYKHEGKEYEIALSWESSDSSVISISGDKATVIRPAYGTGDKSVNLTCTLTIEGKTKTKVFPLEVYQAEQSVEEVLDAAKAELDTLIAAMNPADVTEDITMPTRAGLASVTWVSDDVDTISLTGKVTRPIWGEGDKNVKITVTLTSSSTNRNVEYTFVVKEGIEPEDALKPELAANYLLIDATDLSQPISLPTTGKMGTTITWESSNEAIIALDGTVTRPAASSGKDVKVVLIATIAKGDVTFTKPFTISVPELEPANNSEKAQVAYNILDLNLGVVTSDVLLPVSGLYDTTFEYQTTSAAITIEGNKIKVARDANDNLVNVTVTCHIGDDTFNYTLTFVVKSTSKGAGTVTNPFVVETAEDFVKIGSGTDGWSLNAHYALFADIDLSTVCSETLGSYTPIGTKEAAFKGTLNGNGYVIKNLYFRGDVANFGLFGYAEHATFENIIIRDFDIVNENAMTGGLVGWGVNCTIRNIDLSNVNIHSLSFEKNGIKDGTVGALGGRLDGNADLYDEYGPLLIERITVTNSTLVATRHSGVLAGNIKVSKTSVDPVVGTHYVVVRDCYVQGTARACQYLGGVTAVFTGLIENVIADTVLERYTNNEGIMNENQNVVGQFVGCICAANSSYNGLVSTTMRNCVFVCDWHDMIETPAGRTATLQSNNMTNRDNTVIENMYMTSELYCKNGSGTGYTDGDNGEPTAEENVVSYNWYYSNLKSFDFENVWEMTDGSLPTLKFDRSVIKETAVTLAIGLPTETAANLTLVANPNIFTDSVVWTSSDLDAIALDGTVTRPAFVAGNKEVTLTATFTIDGVEYTKKFVVTVVAEEPTNDEKHAVVKAEIDASLGENRTLEENLVIPTTSTYNAELVWTSDNEALTNTGVVTRPASNTSNVTVTLTLQVTIDEVMKEYSYTYVVLKQLVPLEVIASVESVLNSIPAVLTENLQLLFDENAVVIAQVLTGDEYVSYEEGIIKIRKPSYEAGDIDYSIRFTISCKNETKDVTVTGKVSKEMGNGSVNNPWIVDSYDMLAEVGRGGSYALNHSYKLVADIDLTDKPWTPIPASFSGNFDGNGHTISNLTINATSQYAGFFSRLNKSTVRNLTITNANVTTSSTTAGILVGQVNNADVIIENCHVQGSVTATGTGNDDIIGGLVGLINCRANGLVTTIQNCSADVNVTGDGAHIGGMFGQIQINQSLHTVTLKNLYAKGSVNGAVRYSGGFIGTIAMNNKGNDAPEGAQGLVVEDCVCATSFTEGNTSHKSGNGLCGGFVGALSTNANECAVTIRDCVVYGAYTHTTNNYHASFCGRNQIVLATFTNVYVTTEPFADNASQGVPGTKLTGSETLETLGLSSEVWELVEGQAVLK